MIGGLYDYGARFYDPALGRFVSADTVVPQAGNPQALNRYSYCLNSPLNYVDPSGYAPIIDDDKYGNPILDRSVVNGGKTSTYDSTPTWIIDRDPGIDVTANAARLVDAWLDRHPDYNPYLDSSLWTTNNDELFPRGQYWYFVTIQYPYWRYSRGEGELLAQQVAQFPMIVLAGADTIPAGYRISTHRLPGPNEFFIRYETGDLEYTRVTPQGGLKPGTYGAPASEPLLTQTESPARYNLPRPDLLRTVRFNIYPRPTDWIIGPRPVAGGKGDEAIFLFGTGPGTVFGPEPVPR